MNKTDRKKIILQYDGEVIAEIEDIKIINYSKFKECQNKLKKILVDNNIKLDVIVSVEKLRYELDKSFLSNWEIYD